MLGDLQSQVYRRRLVLVALFLTFALGLIAGRLVAYQVGLRPEITNMAHQQRSKEREVPAPRGRILDANGYLLGLDVVQWDVEFSPTWAISDQLANKLADLLHRPREEILAIRSQQAKWALVQSGVPQEIGEQVAAIDAAGLFCKSYPHRVYPMAELTAHVIGFVNTTRNGFYGVEGYHNEDLKGRNGWERFEAAADYSEIPLSRKTLNPAERGADLVLTLDLNIQYIAYQELQRALDAYKAESGSVIVMDPSTGALLAVVSLPSYDPNQYGVTESQFLADPVVSSMWEPGSVLKIVTWAAGLDTGTIRPDTQVLDKGTLEVGGRVIANSGAKAYGKVDMTEALAYSLNTVAAHISTTMGKEQFYSYLRRFGFGSLTGVDLASEGPGLVKFPGDADWSPSELGTNSFGQGIAVTPIQMITAVAAVANRGLLMEPYIVQRRVIYGDEGEVQQVSEVQPKAVRKTIATEAAETLTQMLVEAAEHEAKDALVPGYRIAGKTGTAEVPTATGYHAKDTKVSFVGYAPADDPQFVMLVKLDRPRTSQWAAHTAVPVFGAIAERLFAYLRIPPDEMRLAQK
jgi:cell division protein FtsI/penicillin-binding protein 2